MELASYIPQWLSDLEVFLSLLGFLITLWVVVEVRDIKTSFLRRARLPELVKDLAKSGSGLSTSLETWPMRKHEATSHVKVAATLLKTASKFAPKEERADLNKILKKLQGATIAAELSQDAMWDLYSDIQSAISSLTQLSKNIKWE